MAAKVFGRAVYGAPKGARAEKAHANGESAHEMNSADVAKNRRRGMLKRLRG